MPGPAVDSLSLVDLDHALHADERAIRETVRTFGAKRLRPHIAEWFESGNVPARELAPELGDLGLFGMHLNGYGCAGTSTVAYGMACHELEAVDSGLRSLVSVQGSLAMFAIHRYGSDDQRQQWLPAMAKGEAIGCFGLTESDAGSDPASMRTTARRDGSGWVLDGTKLWITNGTVADVAIVWARTDEGIRGFVVPTDAAGFSAREIGHKLSLRASVSAELVLDGVRLPADAALPEAQGLGAALGCLAEARLGIAFGALGAASDSLETAIAYAEQREVFGRPLAGYQLTQAKLADMTAAISAGMLLAVHLGRLHEARRLRPEQVSLGKLHNVRTALHIARECRTILGASGITTEYSPMRHANNLETVLTYEGTTEVHQLVVGQALTGRSAFR
ncbi:MAG: acyl-CoA dehydrogenase family protein [Actinomycetota bacterium]|nr:acyl-CoA dehydrogenase family protein [Actinomycetota bacterium]